MPRSGSSDHRGTSSDAGARLRNERHRRLPNPQRRERRLPRSRPRSVRRHVVLKLYTPVWIPHLEPLTHVIDETCKPAALVLRLARTMADQRLHGLSEGMALIGESAHRAGAVPRERLDVRGRCRSRSEDRPLPRPARQPRPGRLDVGRDASARCVRATGGFGCTPRRVAPSAVTSVDQSEPTLAVAERNFAHNASLPNVRHCEHDVDDR